MRKSKTKKEKIANIAKEYYNLVKIYHNNMGIEERYKKLANLKNPTEEAISEIIDKGQTWTKNICDECGQDKDVIICLGEKPAHTSENGYWIDKKDGLWFCKDCLHKALKLAE